MDLISRQEAIDALRVAYWDANIQSAKNDPCIVDAMTDWAIRQVKALPSAQPERKPGKWIYYPKASGSVTSTAVHFYPVCSECGCEHPIANYCPNCGADMREEQNGLSD